MTSGRPAIDYLSPLPPVRSGIADYSADLLPHLAAVCDLRVVCLEGQRVPPGTEAPSANLDELDSEGRLPLYQIGNNRHHIGIWRRALEQPGIVTLHDLGLHHLLIEATLGSGEDFDTYRRHLEADHGWLGDTFARARRWHDLEQPAMFGIAANRTLLRRQRGVLVHSHWAADELQRQDPDLEVRMVPMAVPLPSLPNTRATRGWRMKAGIPEDVALLGSFGFQTPIKRTHRVIAALARPELADAHLLVGGEVSARIDLEAVARDAGVAERVHFLGFLAFEELQAAIAACDLCLNLRYPTAGETSASLLRLLALGMPSVVSDYAQFAEFDDHVVAKVPLTTGEDELVCIASALGKLLDDQPRLESLGEAARNLVRTRHDPETAAQRIVEACSELADLEPPGDAPPRPFAPTSLLWRRLDGELRVEGADAGWRPGQRRELRLRLENRSLARWLAAAAGTGGVMIDVHWRKDPAQPPTDQAWLPLPHDLDPGDRIDLAVTVRRPLEDARQLVIEPHLREIIGFNQAGGPSWLLELQ